MIPEKDKLMLRIGQQFEANATGPMAIMATVFVISILLAFILFQ